MLRWDRSSTDEEILTLTPEPRTDESEGTKEKSEEEKKCSRPPPLVCSHFSPKRNEQKLLLPPARLH